MDWKAEAIDKLKQYEAKRQALEIIPREIAQVESSMVSIRSGRTDGIAVKGGSSGREDMLLSCIVHKDELERSLERTRLWVDNVNHALKVLTQEEKLVLDRFYIYPAKGNIARLCDELCVEQSAVYHRKDKALRKFTIALYGAVES